MPAGLPPAPPSSMPAEGTLVGDRYKVVKLLDEGAMGRVYLGEHVHMRKQVAIKVLRRELTRVPEVMARFEREAMAAAHIDHVNVAAATDFGKLPDGSVYLVLEFVEGHTLRAELRKGPLPVARALRIARQIASALSAAHALDIVHRDLKPENVMLVERGGDPDFVKVLDFGVAKVPIDMTGAPAASAEAAARPSITKAGMVFGTPDYMAPEQALGQNVDCRADLYSLGVILFEMLAGVRPFVGSGDLGVLGQQLSEGPPTLKSKNASVDVPSSVQQIVRLLLVNEASARLEPAEAVAAALGEELAALEDSVGRSSSDARLRAGRAEREDSDKHRLRRLAAGRTVSRLVQGVPLWGLIALPVVLLGGIAGLVIGMGSEGERSAAEPPVPSATAEASQPAPARAGDEQIAAALKAGKLAVEALSKRFPADGGVLAGLARLQQKARDYRGAMNTIQRALTLDPGAAASAHMKSALWFAAQHDATREETFALLRSAPLGAVGAHIVLDLASTDGVNRDLAARAREWVASGAFEAVAGPGDRLAGSLLSVSTCGERVELLEAARGQSDERLARVIESLSSAHGCQGKAQDDCLNCVSPEVVDELVEAIKARAAAAP